MLKFPFPQTDPRAVAASAIRTDEQPFRFWISSLPLLVPPPTDAFDRKGRRIVVDTHIDPTHVALEIVHPVGRGSTQTGEGKVIDPYFLRLAFWVPLAPSIFKITYQFLRLRVHRDHWLALCEKDLALSIDLLELGIAVGMHPALTCLAVGL